MFIIHRDRKGKPARESAIEDHKIELFDANLPPDEVIFGGRILNMVNDVAHEVAKSHSEHKCLTLSIDFVKYYNLIKREDILTCKATVTKVWEKVIEVGVKVIAEDFRLLDQKKILSAYFTFHAVDISNNPIEPKLVIPETEEEKKRFLEADVRKKIREKRSGHH